MIRGSISGHEGGLLSGNHEGRRQVGHGLGQPPTQSIDMMARHDMMGFRRPSSLRARRNRDGDVSSPPSMSAISTSLPQREEDLPLVQRLTRVRGRWHEDGTSDDPVAPSADSATAATVRNGGNKEGHTAAAIIMTGGDGGLPEENDLPVKRRVRGTTQSAIKTSKGRARVKKEMDQGLGPHREEAAALDLSSGASPGTGTESCPPPPTPSPPPVITAPYQLKFTDHDPSSVWGPCGVELTTSKEAKKWFPPAMLQVRFH